MIDKKALTAREFVRKRFQAVGPGSQTEPGDTTNFHRHIRKLCESHGAGPKTWNGHQLLLISGLEPNLTAAVTWMLIHLLDGDGHLSTSVRNEADSFVEKSDGEIDLCRVSDECPLLQATYHRERVHSGAWHIRSDPWRLHHFDRVVWDEDSEVFGPRRFLYARRRVDDGSARKLRAFGVVESLCPERFLAVHVAVAFVVRLLVGFEVTPVKRPHIVPRGCKNDVGLATLTSDTEILVKRRENGFTSSPNRSDNYSNRRIHDMSPPPMPTPEQLAQLTTEWVEPVDEVQIPQGIAYGLFDTICRGTGLQGSYWYMLPDDYGHPINTTTTYPFLFWLHGAMRRASEGFEAARLYKEAMRAGRMTQTIFIMPQALPVGWYINSLDRKYPIEDVLMNDLLPHVDATFRTNGKRGVEGFSMGGYGALHLAFKFPEQFEGVSAIGPAVLRSLAEEPRERVWDTFQGDQRYYDLNHPINLLEEKFQAIHFAPLHIRLLVGSDDTRLVEAVKSLADSLQRCGILHRNIGVPNIGHDYVAVMEATQPGMYTFWDECLKPQTAEEAVISV
ncbi:esterase [Colletotrichum asianum]|uniref:Esterase n=1 Tax=Colletotrichum asianum TaxID=702518 RepID=A0A8H3VZD4_9PEZI|nr:esterase [Colletotrichum asianum]